MLTSVGCTQYQPEQDGIMLDDHARINHEDVCLSFLFTSQSLGDTLGEQVETFIYFGAFNIFFGSDRGSRNANLRPSVQWSLTCLKLSIFIFLTQTHFKSTQRALSKQSEST